MPAKNNLLVVGSLHNTQELEETIGILEKSQRRIKVLGIEGTKNHLELFEYALSKGITRIDKWQLIAIFGGAEQIVKQAREFNLTPEEFVRLNCETYNFGLGLVRWAKSKKIKVVPFGSVQGEHVSQMLDFLETSHHMSHSDAINVFKGAIQEKRFISNIKRKKMNAAIIGCHHARVIANAFKVKPIYTELSKRFMKQVRSPVRRGRKWYSDRKRRKQNRLKRSGH